MIMAVVSARFDPGLALVLILPPDLTLVLALPRCSWPCPTGPDPDTVPLPVTPRGMTVLDSRWMATQ